MAIHPEYQYLELMEEILQNGRTKPTRGIHDAKSIFGRQLHFDFRHGFPLLTTKKVPFKMPLREMLWFISGSSNIQYLHDHDIHIWDDFADENLNLGPVYGVQWRYWQAPDGRQIDQLQWAIDEINDNPDSKAILVSAWNPADLDVMRLPPCHTMFQFDVIKGKLRMHLYQRSSDVFLGLPFNISQYAMLLYMIAHITGLEARELVISIGNAHLYKNQIEPAKEQLKRTPASFPTLTINQTVENIDDFTDAHFTLEGYDPHPHIKADLVVL